MVTCMLHSVLLCDRAGVVSKQEIPGAVFGKCVHGNSCLLLVFYKTGIIAAFPSTARGSKSWILMHTMHTHT